LENSTEKTQILFQSVYLAIFDDDDDDDDGQQFEKLLETFKNCLKRGCKVEILLVDPNEAEENKKKTILVFNNRLTKLKQVLPLEMIKIVKAPLLQFNVCCWQQNLTCQSYFQRNQAKILHGQSLMVKKKTPEFFKYYPSQLEDYEKHGKVQHYSEK